MNINQQDEIIINRLVNAAKHLEHLHMCEQEGIESGMPSSEDWIEAIDKLSAALEPFKND